jgi:hypothetical protein
MAIRVQWDSDGPFAICDTTAEAIELLKQARSTSNGHAPNGSAATGSSNKPQAHNKPPVGTEQKIESVLNITTEKVRDVLKKLLEYPDGVEGDEFCKAYGVNASGLGGILTSLSKACKKSGLAFEQLVDSGVRFEGSRRYRWMAPAKLLKEYQHKL